VNSIYPENVGFIKDSIDNRLVFYYYNVMLRTGYQNAFLCIL